MENNNDNRKKVIIYGVLALVLILAAFFLVKKEIIKTPDVKKVKTEIKTVKLEIKDLVIEPESPISTSIIRIIPVLNRAKTRNMKYQYRWFVNGDEIQNLNKKILPREFFKKDDRIYCQVRVTEGKQTSGEKRSREFEVANSPPRIQLRPLPKVNIPGNLVYQIDAYDPDNDSLEYNLISPLDKGIQLDSKSGLLKWYVKKLPEKKKIQNEVTVVESSGEGSGTIVRRERNNHEKSGQNPDLVVIVFEVRDSEGDRAVSLIELNLKTGKEVKSTF